MRPSARTHPTPARRAPATLVAAFAAALGVAILAAGPAPAAAEEDEDAPAEAPPATDPTMDTAIEQCDAKRFAFVKLPKEWKSHRDEQAEPTTLASFLGPYTKRDAGRVDIVLVPGAMRATLARAAVLSAYGGGVPEFAKSGPGWAEGAWHRTSGNPPLCVYAKFVEKDGSVLALYAIGHFNSRDAMRDIAQKMIATFRVASAPPAAATPKGMAVRKAGDFDVLTDAPKDQDGAIQKVIAPCAEAREALVKCFKAKPFDESRPVIRFYQDSSRYQDDGKAPFGAAPEWPAYEAGSRQLWARFFQSDRPEFVPNLRASAARQFVRQYFGGQPPAWIETGLVGIGQHADGKPGKFAEKAITTAKEKVQSSKPLDQWIAFQGRDVAEAEQWELFAWHVFFRWGAGKKYAKQYDASLDALRQAGDPQLSADAWKGADFAAMHEEFKSWLGKWKP
ncbi:MAG: hypothetical protein HMLKMBBP_00883 [Planctomycetes bacterium]|nr:hypothetical protein [Planctomycetota bacterium]